MDGILTVAGKVEWRPETLRNILQNEKYIGDALLQKIYTVGFLNKKQVQNNGIYVENNPSLSFPVTFIYRFRKKWCDGQTSTAERSERNGFTVASMCYLALFIARSAVIFTAELHGTTEANTA